jgi:hypothetical protein
VTDQTRREFLEQITHAAAAATAASVASAPAVATARAGVSPVTAEPGEAAIESFRQAFITPTSAAKPMTRWWWFGGAVTPAEITRELTFMRDAGLKGAEIQPVYPVTVDDPAHGVRHVRYFTPEWYDLLRHASREARRLGLQLDLTLGSGWPYGGPFVPTELAARRLRLHTSDAAGPRTVAWDYAPLLGDGDRPVALLLAPVGDDGAPRVEGTQVLNLRRQAVAAGIPVPSGRWRLMLFVDSPTGMQVKRPTFGMEGPVIDHHNREAISLFLHSAGDLVFDAVGSENGPPFHSVFCDSLEVYGADWTARLAAEFERRRGYSIVPYLPALFADIGAVTPHVRYDYHLTLSDLIIEEFFGPLAAWSARRGVSSRVQAHGAMGDVMRGYGAADIPEGENIFLGDRYQVNLKHRRLASSAAHIYGKPFASAETYTWLRTPTFTTTLEMMKAATDSVLLDGITQIVNHGYSYSPPDAGEPGWAFYASTEVNHTQTWWKHYPHLARYVQRTAGVLRRGESVNPVLVYLPMADVYAGHGVGGLHLDVEVQSRLDPALLDRIRQAGYDFDVVNDHALATILRVEAGTLRGGTGRYRVVVVNAARMMPPESAARIAEFARAGGHVIVVGEPPAEAPGMKDREARTMEVRAAFAGLKSAVVPDVEAAIARLGTLLPPDFRITRDGPGDAAQHVGFVHRRDGEADCYFVANVSGVARDLRVEFGVGHRAPERWDPESGRVEPTMAYEYVTRPGGVRVTSAEIRLAPFESCFVVFGGRAEAPRVLATDSRGQWELGLSRGSLEITGLATAAGRYEFTTPGGRRHEVNVGAVPRAVDVTGPWTLALGKSSPVRLERLAPWNEVPGGKGFSGWGAYEASVEVPELAADIEWFVDLGLVHETAQVFLNGRDLGAAWKGVRRVPCGPAVVKGSNRLRVEVANLWIHHVLAHPPGDPLRQLKGVGVDPAVAETAGIRWGTYGEVPAESLPASGLLGPVRVLAMRRIRTRL